jgi:hypothetical protein
VIQKIAVFMLLAVAMATAQYGDYLYIVTPGQVKSKEWRAKYESAYAVEAVQPFGEDGVEQRFGAVYGLSQRVNLSAVASTVIDNGGGALLGAAQVEVMADLLPRQERGLAVAAGGGWLREYQGVQTAQLRGVVGWQGRNWRADGNALLQKPFAENRDAVDVLFSLGASYSLSRRLRLGAEALGEDLEGFWEEEEAEGGAKMLVSSVLAWNVQEKLDLRFGAGPIYYLTSSEQSSHAPRLLPNNEHKTGWMVRVSALYRI